MNRISMLFYLLKARFATFAEEEFDALCKEYSENASGLSSDKQLPVKSVLITYFRNHTPSSNELNVVYRHSDELKWLYLGNISKKRGLTNDEQLYMASFMNFGSVFRFPQSLNDEALKLLFSTGDVRRISAYVRDFALPESYELELIKRYAAQKPHLDRKQVFNCDYRFALRQYLENRKPEVCKSPKVQNELMKVADGAVWEKLCACQSMTDNVLAVETIRELIAKGYRNAMRALLLHSFIPTAELQRYLLSAFPALRWELEISKLRYALRKLEIETDDYWGVEAPSMEEMKLMEKIELSEETSKSIVKIVCKKIAYSDQITPYFCAWIVNECPAIGEEVYNHLRKFAEVCCKKYGESV